VFKVEKGSSELDIPYVGHHGVGLWQVAGSGACLRFRPDHRQIGSYARDGLSTTLARSPITVERGSVPNVAAAWWSSRDLRLPRSNSFLHPLSPESPHETTIPISLTRCLSPPAGVVRPSCPQISYPFPISPQTLAPTPRKLQPNPFCLHSSSLHYLFSKPFSSPQHH
jgi:hypothetical protein